MRRLLVVIVGILATSLGTTAPATAAAPETTNLEVIHVYVYAYDDQYDTAVSAYTITERGPPATYDVHTTYDAVDSRSHGAVARIDAAAAVATTTYTTSAEFAQVARSADTPRGQVEVQVGPSAVIDWAAVAAKTAPAIARSLDDVSTLRGATKAEVEALNPVRLDQVSDETEQRRDWNPVLQP